MRRSLSIAVLVLAAGVGASSARADVRFAMRDGRVSVVASDASVAEILAEWERVGGTRIVNPGALPPERMTIELIDVTEEQALVVLLRHVGGYIAARRARVAPDQSRFDRILLMARSAGAPASLVAQAVAPGEPPGDADEEPAADPGVAEDPPVGGGEAARDPAGTDPTPANVVAAGASARADGAGVAAPEPADGTSFGVVHPMGQLPSRPEPPSRPLASGQMAAQRAAGRAAAAARTGPARDPLPGPPEDPQSASAASSPLDETPPPGAPVEIPPQDPAAQAAFRMRRAVETANPRDFNFPRPQPVKPPVVSVPTRPGGAVPGSTVQGAKGPGGADSW